MIKVEEEDVRGGGSLTGPPRCLRSAPGVTGSLAGKALPWLLADGDTEARGVVAGWRLTSPAPRPPPAPHRARLSRLGPRNPPSLLQDGRALSAHVGPHGHLLLHCGLLRALVSVPAGPRVRRGLGLASSPSLLQISLHVWLGDL